MRNNRIKVCFAALAAACVLLCGCNRENLPSGTTPDNTTTEVVSSEISDSSEPSDVSGSSGGGSQSSAASSSAPQDDPSSSPDSSSDESSESESAPGDPSDSNPESQPPASTSTTPKETQPPNSSTTPPATTTTAAPPPPEVVIPTVKTPTSPGTQTASLNGSVIDYSNASLGYISVKYSGSADKAKVRIQYSADVYYDYILDLNGKTEYFVLSCGSGSYTAAIYERVSGTTYAELVSASFNASIADEVSMFLYPNKFIDFNQNSALVEKAAQLCAGKTSVIDKISAIFVWITENISYDYDLAATVQKGYVPNPDSVLAKRKGICFDYSSLFAAMLRAQGIPTRLVIGYASPDIYHAWNEVYTKETGWITPEVLLKNSGYNLLDSTMYSTAGNKAQFASYMANGSNYSAIYYY